MVTNIEVRNSTRWPNYCCTKDGRIFRISTGKEMKRYPSGRSKYLAFRACHGNKPETVFVHCCVADAWLVNDDPINKIEVNHIDGDKLNNNVFNLEWVTKSQNQRHALNLGLKGKGGELYNSALSDDLAHLICQHLEDGWRINDLSEKFNIPVDSIRNIKTGATFFHIRCLYNIHHDYKYEYGESTVRWVCELINRGNSDKQIKSLSNNSNLQLSDIKRIRYKIRYKLISDEYF